MADKEKYFIPIEGKLVEAEKEIYTSLAFDCPPNIRMELYYSLKRKSRNFLCRSYRKFRLSLFKKYLLYFLPGFLPELTYNKEICTNLLSDRECHCPETTTKP